MPDAALGAMVARFTVEAGNLMHALQSERGQSVLHVISPERRRTPLERTWNASDSATTRLLETLGRSHTVLPQRALEPLGELRALLEVRPCLRVTVTAREVSAREVVARYSAILGVLLTGLDECITLVREPDLARLFDAHRALMRAEEEASLARAYGTLMLAGLVPGDTPVLSRLLAAQQLHLAEFAAGARPRVRNALASRANQPAFQRAEQLERMAAAMGPRHELLTTDEWYVTLTAKLRALREVDDLDANLLLEHTGDGRAARA
jgi:hypothetical protein